MNGLVGYGSSSEDEDDALPTATTATDTSASSHPGADDSVMMNGASTNGQQPGVSDSIMLSSQPTQGPMVGPTNAAEVALLDEEEGDPEDSVSMSERDMLRYLTQPSHPMTSLPPEPNEDADPAVTARFKSFLALKAKGKHFNEDLVGKTSFKNPGLFASLLERADLPPRAQYSSTLPPDVFNLDLFPDWAYKENLLKSQQTISTELEAAKKSQSAAGQRTIEFTAASRDSTGSRDSTPNNPSKRKRT